MAFKFDGVLLEIFSNLPAKAIFKLATVCEDARKLPSNNRFVKKQSVNMQGRDDLGFILQNSFWSLDEKVELHPLKADDSVCYGLPSTTIEFLSNTVHILTCSNGLLFCVDKEAENLLMINPATKSWLVIPPPDGLNLAGSRIKVARMKVVLDCNNGDSLDYNIMFLMKDPKAERFSPMLLLKMFSSKEGTWKEIGEVDRGTRDIAFYHMPKYDKSTETLYILSNYDVGGNRNRKSPYFWPYLVACNIKNLESRFLKIPKDARRGLYSDDCRMDIFKWWRGGVCVVQFSKGMFRVWVVQVKGKGKEKWVRILKMRARALIGTRSLFKNRRTDHLFILGFTVLNGKSLLFATEERVYLYDLKGDRGCSSSSSRKGKVGADEVCEHEYAAVGTVMFHSYSNSLRPCGDGAMPIHIPN